MYTVRWVPSALSRLADVWTRAGVREAVTAAVQRIDDVLASDPDKRGESRDAGRRILLVPPFGVMIKVDAARWNVLISDVWTFEKF
jgi:hypothetical protein